MLTLRGPHQLFVGLGLIVLMAVTRGQHVATLHLLPDASWTVFFFAGVYLRPFWVFPGLLAFGWLLDFSAVTWGGISDFCLSPAYVFLLPAYAALWFSGRCYGRSYAFEWRTLVPLTVSLLCGAAACELISSGGFYLFSGRFTEATVAEFGVRLWLYFPSNLQSMLFYTGSIAVVHSVFALVRNTAGLRRTAGA